MPIILVCITLKKVKNNNIINKHNNIINTN